MRARVAQDEDLIAHSTLFFPVGFPISFLKEKERERTLLDYYRGWVQELWLVSPGHKVDRDEILKRVNVRREPASQALNSRAVRVVVVPVYETSNSHGTISAYKYQK